MDGKTRTTLLGAGLAAIGATACCAGPLVLLALGISGAWIGTLTKLQPFRPIFIGLVVILMVLAYRRLYAAPACERGDARAIPAVARRQRVIFWIVFALVGAVASSPWYLALVL